MELPELNYRESQKLRICNSSCRQIFRFYLRTLVDSKPEFRKHLYFETCEFKWLEGHNYPCKGYWIDDEGVAKILDSCPSDIILSQISSYFHSGSTMKSQFCHCDRHKLHLGFIRRIHYPPYLPYLMPKLYFEPTETQLILKKEKDMEIEHINSFRQRTKSL